MQLRSLLIAIAFAATTCFAAPPDLERADAKRILEFMEWKDVSVIAIRQE
jgi:starvation-inducible outer membrane lipoprotein